MTHASTNAQVDLYGATWATRFQALRSAYGFYNDPWRQQSD